MKEDLGMSGWGCGPRLLELSLSPFNCGLWVSYATSRGDAWLQEAAADVMATGDLGEKTRDPPPNICTNKESILQIWL